MGRGFPHFDVERYKKADSILKDSKSAKADGNIEYLCERTLDIVNESRRVRLKKFLGNDSIPAESKRQEIRKIVSNVASCQLRDFARELSWCEWGEWKDISAKDSIKGLLKAWHMGLPKFSAFKAMVNLKIELLELDAPLCSEDLISPLDHHGNPGWMVEHWPCPTFDPESMFDDKYTENAEFDAEGDQAKPRPAFYWDYALIALDVVIFISLLGKSLSDRSSQNGLMQIGTAAFGAIIHSAVVCLADAKVVTSPPSFWAAKVMMASWILLLVMIAFHQSAPRFKSQRFEENYGKQMAPHSRPHSHNEDSYGNFVWQISSPSSSKEDDGCTSMRDCSRSSPWIQIGLVVFGVLVMTIIVLFDSCSGYCRTKRVTNGTNDEKQLEAGKRRESGTELRNHQLVKAVLNYGQA